MNSNIHEITIPVMVHKQQTMRYGLDFDAQVIDHLIPINVRQWIESGIMKEFQTTHEEDKYMEYLCERKMVFEVEVEYTPAGQAKGATCHTVCPNFVKAWVEKEAMKQFNLKEVVNG